MAGYIIGSKSHYKFLIALLMDISDKLKSSKFTEKEKEKLYANQASIMNELMEYFEDGEPK